MAFWDDVGSAFESVGEAVVKTAVSTVVAAGQTVVSVGEGIGQVATGDAFRDGGWVYNAGNSVADGWNDVLDGSFVDKDGWLTNFTEDVVPFGGFATAGFHAGAENWQHAGGALLHGTVTGAQWATGSFAAGRAGSQLMGGLIGSAGHIGALAIGDVVSDQFLDEHQQDSFTNLSVGSVVAAGAYGGFAGVLSKRARDANHLHKKNVELRDDINPSGDYVTYGTNGSVSHIDYGPTARGAWQDRAVAYQYKQQHGQGIAKRLEDGFGEGIDRQLEPGHFAGDLFRGGSQQQGAAPQPVGGGVSETGAYSQGLQVQYAGQHDQSGQYESWIEGAGQYYQSSPGYDYQVDAHGDVSWTDNSDQYGQFDQYGRFVGGYQGGQPDFPDGAGEIDYGFEPGEWAQQPHIEVTDDGEWISDGATLGWVHEDTPEAPVQADSGFDSAGSVSGGTVSSSDVAHDPIQSYDPTDTASGDQQAVDGAPTDWSGAIGEECGTLDEEPATSEYQDTMDDLDGLDSAVDDMFEGMD